MNLKQSIWKEIGILLGNDPKACVICPECEIMDLDTKDIVNEDNKSEFERMIYCKNCGASIFLRMYK